MRSITTAKSNVASGPRAPRGQHGASRASARGRRRHPAGIGASLALGLVLAGCAHVPNQWVEDGPGVTEPLVSPTAADIYDRQDSVKVVTRFDEPIVYTLPPHGVTHWPLYFEDPFEDKGHGREGLNKYRLGWEDYVALAYSYPRFTANWLMLPVSMVVTPPWTLMVSDARLSQQLLGTDHDAAKARHSAFDEPVNNPVTPDPAAEPAPPRRARPAPAPAPQRGVTVEPA